MGLDSGVHKKKEGQPGADTAPTKQAFNAHSLHSVRPRFHNNNKTVFNPVHRHWRYIPGFVEDISKIPLTIAEPQSVITNQE